MRSVALTSRVGFEWIGAIGLCTFSLWMLADFPVVQTHLLVFCLIYAAILWFWPRAWLLVLPIVLPLLDLAPWSGRFLLDEFDALICLTVAIGLVRHEPSRHKFKPVSSQPFYWLMLLLLSYLLSFGIGFLPYQALDQNAWSNYYSNWNAVRLLKGFLGGAALVFLFSRQRAHAREQTDLLLLRGLVAGVLMFGCIVLWERGVFSDLLRASDIYGALGGLLDFNTRHRITGLFSQMHLGGAAVDGFLVLGALLPLLLLFKARQRFEYGWAFAALVLALYAVLVSFTRGTYATVLLSGVIFFCLLLRHSIKRGESGLHHWGTCFGLAVLAVLVMLAGFQRGGSITTFALTMAILGGGGYSIFVGVLPKALARVAIVLGLFAVVWVAIEGMLTSKYANVTTMEALLFGGGGAVLLVFASLATFRQLTHEFQRRTTLSALFVMVLVVPMTVVGLSNTRMEVRFSEVGRDLDTRVHHWTYGYELRSDSLFNQWFGLGLGKFPTAYLLNADPEQKIGSIWFSEDMQASYIRLGGGVLRTGQRLDGQVNGPFTLRIKARQVSGKSKLEFRLCQRPLLVQEAWNQNCANARPVRLSNAPGWQTIEVQLDFEKYGALSWYQPKFLLFSFGNVSARTVVDVAELQLIDDLGLQSLQNSGFQQGGDRWMIFSDFEHLPWHAKNLYLHIYLEQGWLGLLMFGLVVFASLRASFRQALQGDVVSMGLFSVVVGFLGLGLVATLFDVPRLVSLFYLLIFWPLIKGWQKRVLTRRRRRSSPKDVSMELERI